MAYRRNPRMRGHETSAAEESYNTNRQFNNDRLRKAINYMENEGHADETSTYVNRVEAINEHILQKFPAEGAQFDHRLYRTLQKLVRNVQDDFELVDEDDSALSVDSDESIEEILSPEALYRGDSPSFGPSGADDMDLDMADPSDDSELDDAGRPRKHERVHRYGGPKNDPEEWHRNLPAYLPFGENLMMEKWESMKINFDLRESSKRLADDADPVTTRVPYDAIVKQGGFKLPTNYTSGSRFLLPDLNIDVKDNPADNPQWWKNIISEFNNGGRGHLEGKKGYVPRLVLPRMKGFAPGSKYVEPFAGLPSKVRKPRPEEDYDEGPSIRPKPASKKLDKALEAAKARTGAAARRTGRPRRTQDPAWVPGPGHSPISPEDYEGGQKFPVAGKRRAASKNVEFAEDDDGEGPSRRMTRSATGTIRTRPSRI